MLQFLFDTDHLTLYQHKHQPLMLRIGLQPPDTIGICPINIEETMRGRLAVLGRTLTGIKHVQAYAHLAAAEEMFRLFPLVPFDNGSENQFQRLRASRLRVGTLDLKIAAIALVNDLTVLTRNRSDFGQVPGLKLADWSQ
jgi:tRNA(fMet)-specific endonuclease VapC